VASTPQGVLSGVYNTHLGALKELHAGLENQLVLESEPGPREPAEGHLQLSEVELIPKTSFSHSSFEPHVLLTGPLIAHERLRPPENTLQAPGFRLNAMAYHPKCLPSARVLPALDLPGAASCVCVCVCIYVFA
jgi:hypothetical protein